MRPPITATIRIRRVVGVNNVIVPSAQLKSYFGSCNVILDFQEGAMLDFDPSDMPAQISSLESELLGDQAESKGLVLLILAQSSVSHGPSVNGALLNPQRRSISAIYTSSDNFRKGPDEARFEIFAHEIGHVFNLVHQQADTAYPTAMAQYDSRQSGLSPRQIWALAHKDYVADDVQRTRGYLDTAPPGACGLPFSPHAMDWIARKPAIEYVRPWGRPFQDTGTISFQDRAAGAVLSLVLERSSGACGDSLDFTVRIDCRQGYAPITVPIHLSHRFGTLNIVIEAPGRPSRTLVPDTRGCTGGSQTLGPGQSAQWHYSILKDRNGLVFPTPGRYNVRIEVPQLGLTREALIRIKRTRQSPSRMALLNALGSPLPLDATMRRYIDRLLASHRTLPALRAHLIERLLHEDPLHPRAPELLKSLDALQGAPLRLRQRIDLQRRHLDQMAAVRTTLAKTNNPHRQESPT